MGQGEGSLISPGCSEAQTCGKLSSVQRRRKSCKWHLCDRVRYKAGCLGLAVWKSRTRGQAACEGGHLLSHRPGGGLREEGGSKVLGGRRAPGHPRVVPSQHQHCFLSEMVGAVRCLLQRVSGRVKKVTPRVSARAQAHFHLVW